MLVFKATCLCLRRVLYSFDLIRTSSSFKRLDSNSKTKELIFLLDVPEETELVVRINLFNKLIIWIINKFKI